MPNSTYKLGDMTITERKITVEEIVNGYEDFDEGGVVGYGGLLDIRPAFQREFVYDKKESDAVIRTIMQGFPLNIMYWAKCDAGEFEYEVLDGQQRTISFCRYIKDNILVDFPDIGLKGFNNLTPEQKNKIKKYPLTIYICEGTQEAKLEWFKIINIAGEPLKAQELRNAIYTGPWLSDAKRYFSKNGCVAKKIGDKYITGTENRQEILGKALSWIADRDKDLPQISQVDDKICGYMALHQNDDDANDLYDYYKDVIDWAKTIFPRNYKEKAQVEWGFLYNRYHTNSYDVEELSKQVEALYGDRDVTAKKNIFEYVLGGELRILNIRAFDDIDKRAKYHEQGGICPCCKKHFEYEEMQGDHIIPWAKGGHTVIENLQMLCKTCNGDKSSAIPENQTV